MTEKAKGGPDLYFLRARVFPGLAAVVPAIALAFTLASWKDFHLAQVLGALGISALTYLFADYVRQRGQRLERGIFDSMGGKPSTAMLRHRDTQLDAEAKKRYVTFLAKEVGRAAPTASAEAKDPAAADAVYELYGNWLRERTSDSTAFRRLYSENVTYGMRRNLLGIKPIGLGINALCVIISAGITYYKYEQSKDFTPFLLMLIIAAVHLVYFLHVVTEDAVKEAAWRYARQLILTCEQFMTKKAPTK